MLEQIFQQEICTCFHSISEEHENGKCYALDYNGIYSACNCRSIHIMPSKFSFKVEFPDEIIPTNPITKIESTNPISTIQKQSTIPTAKTGIQWGRKSA